MKAIRKTAPLALLGVAAIAALALLALGLPGGRGDDTAHAQGPITLGVDMDPTGNACTGPAAAGETCTLGTIDACVSVSDVVGTTFNVDAFVSNLDNGHSGWNWDFLWPDTTTGANLTMTAQIETDPAVNLIAQSTGSSPFTLSEGVPDTLSPHGGAVADFGTFEDATWTHGVESRMTFQVGAGAVPGVYPLFGFGPGTYAVTDQFAANYTDITIQDNTTGFGILALGVPCPSFADVAITAQTVLAGDCTSPPPSTMDVGTDTALCLHKTIVNSGPTTPVDVSIATSLTGPGDCTITFDPTNPTSFPGLTSTPETVNEKFTVNCSQPSLHSFSFGNAIDITTASVADPNTANNSLTTQFDSVPVEAEADLAIAIPTVTAPATVAMGDTFVVSSAAGVTNLGPFQNVTGEVFSTLDFTLAPGCSTADTNPQVVQLPSLGAGTANATWNVSCLSTGAKTFDVDVTVDLVTTTHVSDPNAGNDSNLGVANTDITPASADISVTQALFAGDCTSAAPTFLVINTNTNVCLRKTIHDAGPFPGSVNVSITNTATAPTGCTATFNDGPSTVSVSPAADTIADELWILNCSEIGEKIFTFDNALAITTVDVTDPTPGNNAFSSPLTVTAGTPTPTPTATATSTATTTTTVTTTATVTTTVTTTATATGTATETATGTATAAPETCAPVIPGTYNGLVRLNGVPAADGFVVTASIGGTAWGDAIVSGGRYALDIPETLPVSPPCFEGGTITFTLDGGVCEEAPDWASGLHDLDLNCAPAPPPSTPTPPSTATPPATGTPVGTPVAPPPTGGGGLSGLGDLSWVTALAAGAVLLWVLGAAGTFHSLRRRIR